MTSAHNEGTLNRPRRNAASLLWLSFEQLLSDPVNHRLLNGKTDLASVFRDNDVNLCRACANDGERAVVVSRPCPAPSLFGRGNTGGVPA